MCKGILLKFNAVPKYACKNWSFNVFYSWNFCCICFPVQHLNGYSSKLFPVFLKVDLSLETLWTRLHLPPPWYLTLCQRNFQPRWHCTVNMVMKVTPHSPLTENAFDIEFNLLEINSLNLLQKPLAAQNRMWILWQIRVSDQTALIQFRLEGVGWRGRLGYVKGGLKWPGLGWGIRVG